VYFALVFFSAALIVLSFCGALLPARLLAHGLSSAVVVRIIFAALLWMNAQQSYTPTTFKALSILLVLSAVAHFVVGRKNLAKLRNVLATLPLWAIRLPCLFGAAMGIFVIWSLSGDTASALVLYTFNWRTRATEGRTRTIEWGYSIFSMS